MSLYKRAGSPYYYYDFQAYGERYNGSTKTADKRKAQKAEDRARAAVEAARLGVPVKKGGARQMTLGEATAKFWAEKGQHEKGAQDVCAQLKRLKERLGEATLLSAINTEELIAYRDKRRADTSKYGRPLQPRTINADLELYRRMIAYADDVWSKDGCPLDTGSTKKWKRIRLRTPKARVRELSKEEEIRLFAHLRPDYHDVVEFAIFAGYRRGALLLRWADVDFGNKQITVSRKSDIEGETDVLPMSAHMRTILERQKRYHPEWVFTYVAKRARVYLRDTKQTLQREKGDRHPITYQGLGSTLSRAVKQAGLKDWRLLHDLRHTAATRTLRSSGNIVAVQHMLAHKDLASTGIYAHAMSNDVRNAMDTVSPVKVPTLDAREATPADFGF